MVGFVDDDIVVIICRQLLMERLRIERLYGDEQVVQRFRFISPHIEFAEIGVLQHACKSVAALFENFLTVSNEQQTVCFSGILFAEAAVVQCGNNCLAGTCGSDHEIAPDAANHAFGQQFIENFLLIGIWADVEQELWTLADILFSFQCLLKTFALGITVEAKFIGMPVGIKSRGNLADGLWQIMGSDLHVPFKTAGNSCAGKIRGANIRRRKAGITIEHIRLGV